MFVKRLAVSVLVVLASLYVVGCGGGAAATTVAITASATSVDGSDAINITATVSGGDTAGKGAAGAAAGLARPRAAGTIAPRHPVGR